MAIRTAARWRPQIYRSTLETILQNGGTDRVEVLQLVVFNDTELAFSSGNPYEPGSAATERRIAIVDEKVITLAVSAFAGLTPTQCKALWDTEKTAKITEWQNDPAIAAKVNAAIGAYLSTYTMIQ